MKKKETGKKPVKKPEEKQEKELKPRKAVPGAFETHPRKAAAILIVVMLLFAFSLPIILESMSIYVGYEDPTDTLFSVGDFEVTYFVILLFLFFIVLLAFAVVFFREFAHAINEDRQKKETPIIRRPKRTKELYEEKPENRKSFQS